MGTKGEKPFQSELHGCIKEYLNRYGGARGVRLKVKELGEVTLDRKEPDIVITDERDAPVLIIETKRKGLRPSEGIDPLDKGPIAQALCYAYLLKEEYNFIPYIATANRDALYVFDARKLLSLPMEKMKDYFRADKCKEHVDNYEELLETPKSAFSEGLIAQVAKIENPVENVDKLIDKLAELITGKPVPAPFVSGFIDSLHRRIEKYSKSYVLPAIKSAFETIDANYIKEIHEKAMRYNFHYGVLDLLKLVKECKNSKIRDYLGEKLSKRFNTDELIEKIEWLVNTNVYNVFEELKKKYQPREIEKDPLYKEEHLGKRLIDLIDLEPLAKTTTYVLFNKILFYKLLELHYPGAIEELRPMELNSEVHIYGEKMEISSIDDYLKAINKHFEKVSERVKEKLGIEDFAPIFNIGPFDMVKLSGEKSVIELNDAIKFIDLWKKELMNFPGLTGYVYERLIPPSERHQLGQFYTPPAICRLIVRFAVRGPGDVALDSGSGSGTFSIEAYKRLLYLKYSKVFDEGQYPECGIREGKKFNEHQGVLDQIHAIDVHPFAAHLTSIHLSLMQPKCPVSRLNVYMRDFFAHGDLEYDAIIGNPPYTRWVEIPEDTQGRILEKLGSLIDRYGLTPAPQVGKEPGIYVYWIMHATNLLKEGGRLGMIISNMWLQTDYGISFGEFLLNNFRIVALIDLSYRLFEALISTVILLAEKESDAERRRGNVVTLIRIPPKIGGRELAGGELHGVLDELLRGIEGSIRGDGSIDTGALDEVRKKYGIWFTQVKQCDIPRDKKWISLFFEKVEEVVEKIETHPLMKKASEWFEPSYGNAVYLCLTSWRKLFPKEDIRRISGPRNLGAKEFFYFSEEKKNNRGIPSKYLAPAITRSQYIRTFTFTMDDWNELKESSNKNVYIFMCHEPRDRLPQEVQSYIRWGETECRTRIRGTRGGGRLASEAEASRARQRVRRPLFYGWYDLGGYIPTPIMAIRQPRYHPQFFLCEIPVVTYDAIITFIPKVRVETSFMKYDPGEFERYLPDIKRDIVINEVEVKALLAYLNSTFNWLWVEQNARYIAKGPIGLEAHVARDIPILNVKAVERKEVEELAKLFDELEEGAREVLKKLSSEVQSSVEAEGEGAEEEIGGIKLEMIKRLRPALAKIDEKIAEILNLPVNVDALWDYAWEMMERRVRGAKEPVRPGAESVDFMQRRKGRKRRSADSLTLDMFFS
jgi:type I restriction-modification system DNA methylase subunit